MTTDESRNMLQVNGVDMDVVRHEIDRSKRYGDGVTCRQWIRDVEGLVTEIDTLKAERDEARGEVAAMLNTDGYQGPFMFNGSMGQFEATYRLMAHWRVRAEVAEGLTDPNAEMVIGNHAYRTTVVEAERDRYRGALETIANDPRLGPGWIAALVRKTLTEVN